MSVFRFERNSGPTPDQMERFMIGKIDEERFGPGKEIVLEEYPEAYFLVDARDGTRILYTGFKDKQKAFREVVRRLQRYYPGHRLPAGMR